MRFQEAIAVFETIVYVYGSISGYKISYIKIHHKLKVKTSAQ
jgi:predicted small integral membrane protein